MTKGTMTEFDWKAAIEAIHRAPFQAVIAVTGGGSSSIGRVLAVPGGSRTLLEAVVPYSHASLEDWLGREVEQACNPEAARAMAMAAWERARLLAPEIDPLQLVGIGATASLVSSRPKRGEHRVHVALQTAQRTLSRSLVLEKGARDRSAEEKLAADLVLGCLATAAELSGTQVENAISAQLLGSEEIDSRQQLAEPHWTELLLDQCSCTPIAEPPRVVFPGSFNPPHAGHVQMADYATRELDAPVAFELSITNVDKPALDFIEIAERLDELKQLDKDANVLLTNAPTFLEKSHLFPGATFLVGADTVARIADPRYYAHGNSDAEAAMKAAITEIADRGCHFLVFGREIKDRFCLLSDLEIPASLHAICTEVPADEFRLDISSTELRQRAPFE